ncbi:MAG TPA: ribosome-associated translation inhibitor RaiA [Edaphobacter sp.]
MNVELTGRQTAVTPKLKQQAEQGLQQISTIVGKTGNCHVILTEDKYRKIAEVTVKGKEIEFVATAEGADMGIALHDALAKVEQQTIRHNQRQTTTRRHPKDDLKTASAALADTEDVAL